MNKSLAELGLTEADLAPKPEALQLPPEIIARLDQETKEHGGDECCGFVIEINGKMEVVPIENTLEAKEHVYHMDQDGIIKLYRRLEKERGTIVALYHSHTSHQTAHFSQSDASKAFAPDHPSQPIFGVDTPYIVIAAQDGKVRDRKAFTYNPASKAFRESAVIAASGQSRSRLALAA